MSEQLTELLENLPSYLGGHMLLSLTALLVGLVLCLPLGVYASRRPRLAELVLGLAGVVQTIPSLALLALMVLLLDGLIGFWPAFLALTLYSVLPILANTITGIRGVDPTLIEAARGLGMSERQMLFQVQLPLASPVMIAGIRTATVLVVGTATLVTPVGGLSLGNYIFSGLASLNHAATIFGCILAAVLAVLLDQLVRLLQVAAQRRSRALAWAGAVGLLLVLAGGLFDPVRRLFSAGAQRSVIASGPFTEQDILSELMARRLETAGFQPDRRKGMSEGIQIEALRQNQVDCLVNYSGNIWTLVMKRKDLPDKQVVLAEVTRYLQEQHGIVCLGSLGFEDAYALAVPRAWAAQHNVHSVDDLVRYGQELARRGQPLKLGGDEQFFDRPEWFKVRDTYVFQDQHLDKKAMGQTLMYGAVVSGQVDAIVAYTSDGRIKAFDLEVLADPRQAFPPYDAVLLVSPEAARRPGFVEGLRPLVGGISLDLMQEANRQVDIDKRSPVRVADWMVETMRRQARGGRGAAGQWDWLLPGG